MVSEAIARSLQHVLDALGSLSLPAAVLGGLAVATWNHFRATKDVDLLVGISEEDPSGIVRKLDAFGMQPKHDPPVLTMEGQRIIQLLYEPPDTFLEVQIALLLADSAFSRSALSRRVALQLPDVNRDFAVLTCEDLVIFKLLAGRIIDRADAAALLRINRKAIDLDYLTNWICRLRLESDFAEIWREASPDEAVPIL